MVQEQKKEQYDQVIKRLRSLFDMHHVAFGAPANLGGLLHNLHDNRHFAMDFWSVVNGWSAAGGGSLSDDELLEAIVEGATGVSSQALPDGERPAAEALKQMLAGIDVARPAELPEAIAAPEDVLLPQRSRMVRYSTIATALTNEDTLKKRRSIGEALARLEESTRELREQLAEIDTQIAEEPVEEAVMDGPLAEVRPPAARPPAVQSSAAQPSAAQPFVAQPSAAQPSAAQPLHEQRSHERLSQQQLSREQPPSAPEAETLARWNKIDAVPESFVGAPAPATQPRQPLHDEAAYAHVPSPLAEAVPPPQHRTFGGAVPSGKAAPAVPATAAAPVAVARAAAVAPVAAQPPVSAVPPVSAAAVPPVSAAPPVRAANAGTGPAGPVRVETEVFAPKPAHTLTQRGLAQPVYDAEDDPRIREPHFGDYGILRTDHSRTVRVAIAALIVGALVAGGFVADRSERGHAILQQAAERIRDMFHTFKGQTSAITDDTAPAAAAQRVSDAKDSSSAAAELPPLPAANAAPETKTPADLATDAPAQPSSVPTAIAPAQPSPVPPTVAPVAQPSAVPARETARRKTEGVAAVRPRSSAPFVDTSVIRVPASAMAANLALSRIPAYPESARAQQIEGRVTMEVVISATGAVKYVHAIDGDRRLRAAAEDAVMRWRYKPYLLHGEPVDVTTTVQVDFRLPE